MQNEKSGLDTEELNLLQAKIKDQEEEILKLREELVSTTVDMQKQKRELELTVENLKLAQSQLIQSEKMASVGVLTAGIAHELNNPINFMSGNVHPLQQDMEEVFALLEKYEQTITKNDLGGHFAEVDELKKEMDFSYLIQEIYSLLKGIEEGANRSKEIIKGLRSFSRLDDEACQIYDIHEGIDSSLVLLQNKIIDKKILVRKDYGDFEGVECFPSKLNQVIMNILTNSLQAMEAGSGELFIQTVSSAIGVKIIIKDNGKGMTPDVKEHIFDPFFTTKEVGKGMGLGLSISYGIIEKHNGNIDVISEPGKGTEFIISLPRMQSNPST
jgi:signal transduction histidine kinase